MGFWLITHYHNRFSPPAQLPQGLSCAKRHRALRSLHPTRHDQGCAPCISKNLKLWEIPNCFFSLVEGASQRSGDSFQDFARCVTQAAFGKTE